LTFINNFARFSALLFPYFAIFHLVKKLIRFLGNSAIRRYLLAWSVSWFEKRCFSAPDCIDFSHCQSGSVPSIACAIFGESLQA
jgi:hypothetical protein